MRRATRGTVAAAALTLAGCVNGFQGANVQLDLSTATPVQADVLKTPEAGQLPAATHFTLYAIQEQTLPDSTVQDHLFEVARFEVHNIVDTSSPCFIDVGDHVPYPGIHVTQFATRVQMDTQIPDPTHPPPGATPEQLELVVTALARMAKINAILGPGGLVAVTSASTTAYPTMAMDCNGPPDQIPPPQCIDNASNQRRLQLCQQTWKTDGQLWEGTDRVLTAPLNGTTYGLLHNPMTVAGTPVGGAQLFVDSALVGVDAYAIYFQADVPPAGMEGPGTQLYFGRPTMPTRGVFHVHLVDPDNAAITSEMAVFADLGQDDVHF
ncbi:MAG TPA: hypothetical protein VHT91_49825 [Kofleriaceae bacterium]|nr:hypothetical protein [Kofleriaceae bacterium]